MTIGHPHNDGLYPTTNTALAAWLYSQGFQLTDVDASSFPSVFYFESSSPKLQESVRDFQVGKAEGNIATFYRSYKRLLSMIKTGYVR